MNSRRYFRTITRGCRNGEPETYVAFGINDTTHQIATSGRRLWIDGVLLIVATLGGNVPHLASHWWFIGEPSYPYTAVSLSRKQKEPGAP